jgi:hypothetical protein
MFQDFTIMKYTIIAKVLYMIPLLRKIMDYLAIVRHGHVAPDGRLSSMGQASLDILGQSIERYVTDAGSNSMSESLIVSSSAPRATESSERLAHRLNSEGIFGDDFLWTGPDAPMPYDREHGQIDRPFTYIREHGDDYGLIVLVTHLELCQDFPPEFTEENYEIPETSEKLSFAELNRGEAYLLDLDKGLWLKMPDCDVVYKNLGK